MKKHSVEQFENLADLFCSIIGGWPDSLEEIDEFLQKSPLKQIFSKHDIEKIIKYDAYFAPEIVDGIYALLPVEMRLNDKKSIILYPKKLRELNNQTETHAGSRVLNVDFSKIILIYNTCFNEKVSAVLTRRAEIENEKKIIPQKKLAEEHRQKEIQKEYDRKRQKNYPMVNRAAQLWREQQGNHTLEEKVEQKNREQQAIERYEQRLREQNKVIQKQKKEEKQRQQKESAERKKQENKKRRDNINKIIKENYLRKRDIK